MELGGFLDMVLERNFFTVQKRMVLSLTQVKFRDFFFFFYIYDINLSKNYENVQ